ncbi:MAG: hypothetical protein KDD73_09445 [Anaerolineales bacterium]|nr:hypothetical protein [Anaerolineales bacterium]MCB9126964.1 hypothetical protein [Ardenticatenales bacterium]MCB9171517.1 hypothetical protein [Ardenticatenales bacterium]
MQLRLTSPELAYLLHSVGARRAVGVNNRQLFPSDALARESLLDTGLAQLRENGHLACGELGWSIHSWLMLMAAIIAAPEDVLTITRFLPAAQRQIVTYYRGADQTVEQYQADERYMLRMMDRDPPLASQIAALVALPASPSGEARILRVEWDQFEAIRKARNGQPRHNRSLLETMQPHILIEAAALAGEQLVGFEEILLLRDGEGGFWSVQVDQAANRLSLQSADEQRLTAEIERMLASFSATPALRVEGAS